MVQVCFHGPLAAPGVLAALAGGARLAAGHIRGAVLSGGEIMVPGIAPGPGELPVVTGDLDGADLAALRYVATVLGLVETERQVEGPAGVSATLCLEPEAPGAAPWQDAEHLGWGAILGFVVAEILGYRGSLSAAEAAGRLPVMLMRAASRAEAAAAAPKPLLSGLGLPDVTMHERRRAYSSYFAVDEMVYSHARFDGGHSEPVLRAVFIASDAVTVLPYDPVRDRVLLVEQVRAAPIARGDATAWILEPVAGRIEPGDSPETTARKEAREEAGLDLGALHFIGDYYPSTGCFSEYLYSYIGIADLPDAAATLAGVAAEGEDIRGHVMPRAELMRRLMANEIPDAPLLVSAFWLELNLERLRGSG
ncbi:NUDIX domain-containing protein [Mangrovicoccus algicola]|uniref:ADP-ribose pyrophosphatase n=1 Tax=Mangrovicoccus algicola TaxID=2771008 RepID=A0A8J6Z3X9_9RHOB|nr:NUDIX domain-containing protein [Mangrovicoccus algicola]MBE3637059.1 NUDIX domain-containing protein [Mangrovicoccus algicola]